MGHIERVVKEQQRDPYGNGKRRRMRMDTVSVRNKFEAGEIDKDEEEEDEDEDMEIEDIINETMDKDFFEKNDKEKKVKKAKINASTHPELYDKRYSMLTIGNFTWHKNGKVVVSELPIGRWTDDAIDKYTERLAIDKIISDTRDCSTTDQVNIEITGMDDPSIKTLRISKIYGLTNMVLVDNNVPIRFGSAEEIMEKFFYERLPYYELRKQNMLNEFTKKIADLELKIRFIQAVKRGDLVVVNADKAVVEKKMVDLNLPLNLLKRITLNSTTKQI